MNKSTCGSDWYEGSQITDPDLNDVDVSYYDTDHPYSGVGETNDQRSTVGEDSSAESEVRK